MCIRDSLSTALQATPSIPEKLTAKEIGNLLGLALHELSFSWDATGQIGYQVLVASDTKKLAADVGDLWNSGMRHSANQSGIICRSQALQPGQEVWWKVRVWDKEGDPSEWSEASPFKVSTEEVKGSHVVLLGGNLIHGMEDHGFFETAVTARWPQHDITFRNIGWPADDVFGTARGEFGSARNTRSWQPPGAEAGFGFKKMLKHISEAKPDTLIVGYGALAAYADTEAKIRSFETGYENLINELEEKAARLILLTPIPVSYTHLTLPTKA